MNKTDLRYIVAKQRLSSLTTEELQRIVDNIDTNMCFDSFNYDKKENKFCPLSIALNLHNTMEDPTDEKIKKELSKRFDHPNIFKGIKGSFYRDNRKEDILYLTKEILTTRKK